MQGQEPSGRSFSQRLASPLRAPPRATRAELMAHADCPGQEEGGWGSCLLSPACHMAGHLEMGLPPAGDTWRHRRAWSTQGHTTLPKKHSPWNSPKRTERGSCREGWEAGGRVGKSAMQRTRSREPRVLVSISTLGCIRLFHRLILQAELGLPQTKAGSSPSSRHLPFRVACVLQASFAICKWGARLDLVSQSVVRGRVF